MSKPSGAIDMTQGKPINLMLRFALPMMIGSIFQSLYSMVDSAVLGRFVGSHALAAIGATTSTTGLILLLATGVTSAISIVLSQYVGANDTDRVRKGIVASGWITLLLGVVLGLISIFAARPLMQLLKTPEDVIDMSVLYIQIVCGCGIAQFAYNAAASILRALGDSKTPLYFVLHFECYPRPHQRHRAQHGRCGCRCCNGRLAGHLRRHLHPRHVPQIPRSDAEAPHPALGYARQP